MQQRPSPNLWMLSNKSSMSSRSEMEIIMKNRRLEHSTWISQKCNSPVVISGVSAISNFTNLGQALRAMDNKSLVVAKFNALIFNEVSFFDCGKNCRHFSDDRKKLAAV